MATGTRKAQCFACGKEKSTYSCGGCTHDFCFTHLTEHRQIVSQRFDEIENARDEFQQTLIEQKQNPIKHSLMQQIIKWENDSIDKIKQTAEECKQILIEHTNQYIIEIENKLIKLTEQLKEIRQENEFNEIDLNQFKTELTKLTEELNKSPSISIQQDSSSIINKISVAVTTTSSTGWIRNGITIAGGNGDGDRLDQLSGPCGIYIDDGQTIYIADYNNHRIVEWKCDAKNGKIVAGGNGPGSRNNQLDEPTDVIVDEENDSLIICDSRNRRVVQWSRQNGKMGQVIISNIDCWGLTMDNNGYLYVSDTEKHEVKRWRIGDKHGTIVAGGNGQGDHPNQLDGPAFIFVDENYSVYISDYGNDRVMKWMNGTKKGIVVAGGQGGGNSLTQLSNPEGIIVDRLDQIYVADLNNHRVMRWCKGATEGNIVAGGNGKGEQSNQFSYPRSLSFDRQGNLYVVDEFNHRIQKFPVGFT